MHPGLKANLPFRRLDPPRSPTLHHLSTQKPHFLHQPLLRRVRLHEVSLRIPHRPDDRRHSVAKLRTALKKRQKRFVTQFRRRHSRASLFRRILTIARTTLNRTPLSGALARVLDRPCARLQFRCAGRDEETAAQPNKETGQPGLRGPNQGSWVDEGKAASRPGVPIPIPTRCREVGNGNWERERRSAVCETVAVDSLDDAASGGE